MLRDTDAEFAIIDSAHKTKSRDEYRDNGTKKVPRYFSTRYFPPP